MEEKREVAVTGGWDLKPSSLSEALQFAKLMADSDLVPPAFKGKPANVLIAVQMGAELDIQPMQAIQNIAVINGKPSIYGDIGKAVLLAKGFKIEMLPPEDVKKQGRGWCRVTRPDGGHAEATFSKEDATKAKLWGKAGPWTDYPERMMNWRAFWFAARDAAADVLKGMSGAEEVGDYPPEKVVDTTAIPMPKRASETVAAPANSSPESPAPVEPGAPAPESTSEDTIIFVADVLKNGDTLKIVDEEGVVFYTKDVELAKTAKSSKGKRIKITWHSEESKPWVDAVTVL